MNIRCTHHAVALAVLLSGSAALAQTPAPESTLGFNVGAVSDYRYRSITQTRFETTAQAGVDYAHKSGFYVGAWGTGIKWIQDAGATDGILELDLYGGYKGAISSVLSYDIGYLRYEYAGNKLGNVAGFSNANTDEIYGALTYGPVTVKYSRSLSNLFGFIDSVGSTYLDVSASFDLGNGWSVTPHAGRQDIANNSAYSYNDYALTLGKDFGNGLSLSLSAIGTNASQTLYVTPKGDFSGKNAAVLGLKYSF